MAELQVQEIQFEGEAEKELRHSVRESLELAIEEHNTRVEFYSSMRQGYKAKPDVARKTFPWDGASNVVVPLIGMTVDALVARFMRAVLGTKDFCEVEIKSPKWERLKIEDPENPRQQKEIAMEDEIRDWISHFVKTSGARDRLRTVFHDIALMGDGFVKPVWTEDKRKYHAYDATGQIVEQEVPEYVGVQWHVPSPDDIVAPRGFDEWQSLPYIANVLRYTWGELKTLEGNGYRNIDAVGEKFKEEQRKNLKQSQAKERDDKRYDDTVANSYLGGVGAAQIFDIYEIHGCWTIPVYDKEGKLAGVKYEEVILSYSFDFDVFIRTIYNPFFGKARHFVRIPFLVQPHELYGLGAGEMILQFQKEASTSHNQVVDAGTAANCGIVVTTDEANWGNNEAIYPGKRIVTPNPDKDFRVVHLNQDSSVLGMMEEKATKYAEARSGISTYHLGMESSVVGSRATATGTTALIGEGNLRFWISIDDIRHAIQELIYLTIQLEQQMRPEGYEWAPGRFIQFPPGDVRTSLGLELFLTSEKINRDIELQNMQLLMAVLNEYYMRVMQASAMILNPAFPAAQKLVAIQIMDASQQIVKRFVERFDIEDTETVVPNLMKAVNEAMGVLNGVQTIPGQGAPGAAPTQPPGAAQVGPGVGAPGTPNG